ncbi:major facilitator superfamily domain-containing protein [Lipomyces tetrasporus]
MRGPNSSLADNVSVPSAVDSRSVIEKTEPEPIAETRNLAPHELYLPDTGVRAWLCVLGSFCGIFCSFGYINVIGVFQEYYMSNQLSSYSPSTISWITSIEVFIMIFGGIIIGRLYDMFGPRPLLIPGTILMVVGIMTTSVCKEYYQFILAQGICTSIGASLVFNPCVSALSAWFIKKRAAALGIAITGSSLGGVILPIMFRQIEQESGFGWGVRALGFLILGLATVSCLTITSRIRHQGRQSINIYKTYVVPFKAPSFTVMVTGIFLVYWGLFIPIGYIPSHAVAHGFSDSLSLYLVSILNAASVFGRILPGILADKFGRYNIYFGACLASGALTLALWLPATGHVPIILFAALFGFFSGASVSVWPALVAEISPIREIGARIGAVSAVASFAALSGMPIAGAIVTHDDGKYWGAAVFAGVSLALGGTIVYVSQMFVRKDKA